MKKLLFIFRLLKSQSIVDLIFDDFLLINKKVYKKFKDIPYTGKIKIPNGKNKFWMITNYKNGLPHGLHKRFFLDGSLMEVGCFKKGNRKGQWKGFHLDGSIDYTITKIYN